MFDVEAIAAVLPHRHPFLLVDRIVEWEPGRRIVGLKNVTINESFFAGHFPGYPVMPGVLIIEALAQAGAFLALKEMGGEGRVAYLGGIENCRFRRPVVPGDQLVLEVVSVARRGPIWKMRGEAKVDGQVAATADLLAALSDRAAGAGAAGGGR